MVLRKFSGFLVLLSYCAGMVRDGQYFQDMCFRLTGSGIAWPSSAVKENYTEEGWFIPANIITTRFQGWHDQVFVTTPRFKPGVPFTVGKFDLLQRCYPCLQPFPSWDLQQGCAPETIHNAVDIFLDRRELLWVLDVGVINTLTNPERKGPPKVVAFEPLSGRMVNSIDLSSLTCSACRLQYLLVDYSRKTGTAWVYVSDASSRTVVVYDVAQSRGHRVVLPEVVNPDGPRDVLYMTLIKRTDRRSRVYFTYLSSDRLFSIRTVDLRYSTNNGNVTDEGTKPAPLVMLGSADNNIFFRYKGKPDIFMWNVDSTFRESNFIPVQEGEEGRLATQVVQGYAGMLWVLESNFQDYVRNTTGCLGASVLLHPLIR